MARRGDSLVSNGRALHPAIASPVRWCRSRGVAAAPSPAGVRPQTAAAGGDPGAAAGEAQDRGAILASGPTSGSTVVAPTAASRTLPVSRS
jgi:hypothetical protein